MLQSQDENFTKWPLKQRLRLVTSMLTLWEFVYFYLVLMVVTGPLKMIKSLYSKQRNSYKRRMVIHFLLCNFLTVLLPLSHDIWGQVLQVREIQWLKFVRCMSAFYLWGHQGENCCFKALITGEWIKVVLSSYLKR